MRSSFAVRRLAPPGIAVQLALTLVVLAGAIVAPPASGAMVLVPVGGGSIGQAIALATAGGGRVLARGPMAGSVVVTGERARLMGPLLAHGILVAAAPRGWCAA